MEALTEPPTAFRVADMSAPEIMLSVAWIILLFQRYQWTKLVPAFVCIGILSSLADLVRPALAMIDALSAGLIITTGIFLYKDFIEDLNTQEEFSESRAPRAHLAFFSFAKGLLAVSVLSSSAYFIAMLGAR